MGLTIIVSPLRGESVEQMEHNKDYARTALRNSLLRGESPFASHLLYTQVLNDCIPEERAAGINAAAGLFPMADRVAVYFDRGISEGMRSEIDLAVKSGVRVVYRTMKKPTEDLRIATFSQSSPAEIVSADQPTAGEGNVVAIDDRPACRITTLGTGGGAPCDVES